VKPSGIQFAHGPTDRSDLLRSALTMHLVVEISIPVVDVAFNWPSAMKSVSWFIYFAGGTSFKLQGCKQASKEGCSYLERGDCRIQVYLSSIQHKNLTPSRFVAGLSQITWAKIDEATFLNQEAPTSGS
jgi:hypothetical protein